MLCLREPLPFHLPRTLVFGLLLMTLVGATLLFYFSTTTLDRNPMPARADHARHSPLIPIPAGRGDDNATSASVSSRSTASQRRKSKSNPRSASQRTHKHAAVNSTVQASSERGQKKLICVEFKCRLGNHMFIYASVLGLARRLNRIPVFLGPYYILHPALELPPKHPSKELLGRCKSSRFIMEKSCCRFDKLLLDMNPESDYRVGKYLQSWKYFQGAEGEVRKAMVFRKDVQQQAKTTMESLRGKCNPTLIGIHVRRGDYLTKGNHRIGRRTPPPDYYRKAMEYMRQRFGNVTFLVSVDNGTWFRDSVTSASDVIVLKRKKPAVDMALLSSLNHVITSVGTYSWWVGYLNKGVTVYWKDFISPGTSFGKYFDHNGTTFIYPGWVPL